MKKGLDQNLRLSIAKYVNTKTKKQKNLLLLGALFETQLRETVLERKLTTQKNDFKTFLGHGGLERTKINIFAETMLPLALETL